MSYIYIFRGVTIIYNICFVEKCAEEISTDDIENIENELFKIFIKYIAEM